MDEIIAKAKFKKSFKNNFPCLLYPQLRMMIDCGLMCDDWL
jgi:hypothetical protein